MATTNSQCRPQNPRSLSSPSRFTRARLSSSCVEVHSSAPSWATSMTPSASASPLSLSLRVRIPICIKNTVVQIRICLVGFIQEQRSEQSLESLNKLVPHHCHIIRDGKQLHLLANEAVPGDLVTFCTGDRIPADLRILSAADLEIDESSLTGETTTRRKDPAPCAEGTEMAERASIAYMGTLVRNGVCSFRFCWQMIDSQPQAVVWVSSLRPESRPSSVSSLV